MISWVGSHLLATEDQTLLGRRYAFLLLDALFDAFDFVGRFDVDLDLFCKQMKQKQIRESIMSMMTMLTMMRIMSSLIRLPLCRSTS